MGCNHSFIFKDGFYICQECGAQIDESSFIENFSSTEIKEEENE